MQDCTIKLHSIQLDKSQALSQHCKHLQGLGEKTQANIPDDHQVPKVTSLPHDPDANDEFDAHETTASNGPTEDSVGLAATLTMVANVTDLSANAEQVPEPLPIPKTKTRERKLSRRRSLVEAFPLAATAT